MNGIRTGDVLVGHSGGGFDITLAADAAPEELSTIANVMPAPPMPFLAEEHHGRLIVMGMMAWSGDPADADAVYAPFRADDLFRGIFGSEREPRVFFQVHDGHSMGEESLLALVTMGSSISMPTVLFSSGRVRVRAIMP